MRARLQADSFIPAPEMPSVATSDPLMMFEVPYPESLSRWKVLVKWILVIPHLVVFGLLAPVFFAVVVVAWSDRACSGPWCHRLC